MSARDFDDHRLAGVYRAQSNHDRLCALPRPTVNRALALAPPWYGGPWQLSMV
jgi:hypothetical protein